MTTMFLPATNRTSRVAQLPDRNRIESVRLLNSSFSMALEARRQEGSVPEGLETAGNDLWPFSEGEV